MLTNTLLIILSTPKFFVGEIFTVEVFADKAMCADKIEAFCSSLFKTKTQWSWKWVDTTIKDKVVLTILTFWFFIEMDVSSVDITIREEVWPTSECFSSVYDLMLLYVVFCQSLLAYSLHAVFYMKMSQFSVLNNSVVTYLENSFCLNESGNSGEPLVTTLRYLNVWEVKVNSRLDRRPSFSLKQLLFPNPKKWSRIISYYNVL